MALLSPGDDAHGGPGADRGIFGTWHPRRQGGEGRADRSGGRGGAAKGAQQSGQHHQPDEDRRGVLLSPHAGPLLLDARTATDAVPHQAEPLTAGVNKMTDGIFEGLKVIDCASWIAGPAAATILSDFGAEVIKIEPPGAGDPWRASVPVPGKTTDYWWQLTSRNKMSLAIDLKHRGALGVLYRLMVSPDGCIPRFPPPVLYRRQVA